MFEDRSLLNVRKCHCRFMLQGSETFLQETAAPDELFLSNECIDTRISNIVEPVNVTFLAPTRDEKPPEAKGPNEYFYRFFYTHELAKFTDAREKDPDPQTVDDCPGCTLRTADEQFNIAVPVGPCTRRVIDKKQRDTWQSVCKWNTVLSVGDFAYFCPFDPEDPETRRKWHTQQYEIGRITAIVRSPEKEKVHTVTILAVLYSSMSNEAN